MGRSALALAFAESRATSVEVHAEGRNFYPPMLEDIASASASIHINQFGFRPGVVGEAFAEALIAKAAEGVRVRLVVDKNGTDPEGGSRALYERLTAAGIEVCVVRATNVRSAAGPLGGNGAAGWNVAGSATSTTASSLSSMGESAGSEGPASRITSRTAASTTSSSA